MYLSVEWSTLTGHVTMVKLVQNFPVITYYVSHSNCVKIDCEAETQNIFLHTQIKVVTISNLQQYQRSF